VNTQTHLLLAAAVLGKGRTPSQQRAILAGALLPDLSIFVLAAWATLTGMPQAELWQVAYWSDGWQAVSAVSNSFPLWGALFAAGFFLKKPWAWLLPAAALLHLAFDLPLHAEDAHRHFWPLTDWRFISPVSYWDPARHGLIASSVEAGLGLFLCGLLWRRHQSRAVRAILALAAAAYILVPIFWIVSLGLL
jgi:hypothetical protein